MLNNDTLYDVVPATWTKLFISWMDAGAWNEDETVDVQKVDSAYLYGHSGNKIISSFTEHFLDEDGKLTDAQIHAMADILFQIFGESWNRLWEINKAEFDPLENYHMTEEEDVTPSGTETEEVTKTGTETDTFTKSGTETNTRTDSGKETIDTTHQGNDTVRTLGVGANNKETTGVYGLDSSSPVPSDEKTVSTDVTVTTTPGASDKEEKTFTNRQTEDVETFTNRQDENVKSFTGRKDTKVTSFDERNTHRELERRGNIGTLTSQQMAKSSLDLWQWKFWLNVFDDIDSFLTCSCY